VDLRKASLEALPIEDGECDAALLVLALSYVPDPASVVGEMARIVKPGGRAVVLDLLRHNKEEFRLAMGQARLGFEPADLVEMLESAGFPGAAGRELTPEPGAKGPALTLTTAERAGRARLFRAVSVKEGERKR
jgi:ArsR family transcriptional regulator